MRPEHPTRHDSIPHSYSATDVHAGRLSADSYSYRVGIGSNGNTKAAAYSYFHLLYRDTDADIYAETHGYTGTDCYADADSNRDTDAFPHTYPRTFADADT